jgi:TM2 domain-containing membrane protein YozV
MLETLSTANMNDRQRVWFYAEFPRLSKNEAVGALLAFFLGGFGIHKFYLGENGLGILYLLFSWTGIPWIISFVECFFMPGRVRAYNAGQAQGLAAAILSAAKAAAYHCTACGKLVDTGAVFCKHCGAAMTQAV